MIEYFASLVLHYISFLLKYSGSKGRAVLSYPVPMGASFLLLLILTLLTVWQCLIVFPYCNCHLELSFGKALLKMLSFPLQTPKMPAYGRETLSLNYCLFSW